MYVSTGSLCVSFAQLASARLVHVSTGSKCNSKGYYYVGTASLGFPSVLTKVRHSDVAQRRVLIGSEF